MKHLQTGHRRTLVITVGLLIGTPTVFGGKFTPHLDVAAHSLIGIAYDYTAEYLIICDKGVRRTATTIYGEIGRQRLCHRERNAVGG